MTFWIIFSLLGSFDHRCDFRYKKEGEGFLSTAQHRNGGNYPENAVKERANLGKFFCVLLCLLPTSYLVNLPTPYMVYNSLYKKELVVYPNIQTIKGSDSLNSSYEMTLKWHASCPLSLNKLKFLVLT